MIETNKSETTATKTTATVMPSPRLPIETEILKTATQLVKDDDDDGMASMLSSSSNSGADSGCECSLAAASSNPSQCELFNNEMAETESTNSSRSCFSEETTTATTSSSSNEMVTVDKKTTGRNKQICQERSSHHEPKTNQNAIIRRRGSEKILTALFDYKTPMNQNHNNKFRFVVRQGERLKVNYFDFFY